MREAGATDGACVTPTRVFFLCLYCSQATHRGGRHIAMTSSSHVPDMLTEVGDTTKAGRPQGAVVRLRLFLPARAAFRPGVFGVFGPTCEAYGLHSAERENININACSSPAPRPLWGTHRRGRTRPAARTTRGSSRRRTRPAARTARGSSRRRATAVSDCRAAAAHRVRRRGRGCGVPDARHRGRAVPGQGSHPGIR